MVHLSLSGEISAELFRELQKTTEFDCPQMPTGRVSIQWWQDKYDALGNLIELEVMFAG